MPVPAGVGIPRSIAGRPRPAWAAARRSILRPAVLAAAPHQQVIRSGDVAISIRSAFWRRARK